VVLSVDQEKNNSPNRLPSDHRRGEFVLAANEAGRLSDEGSISSAKINSVPKALKADFQEEWKTPQGGLLHTGGDHVSRIDGDIGARVDRSAADVAAQ